MKLIYDILLKYYRSNTGNLSSITHEKYFDTRFLAIDFEMSGLDSDRDNIVSVGWVPIRRLSIDLADAFYCLVKSPSSVGSSASIHGLHDNQLANGLSICKVIEMLAEKFPGYVFIFHYADLDLKFMNKAIKNCGGKSFTNRVVDTMVIERSRLERIGSPLRWNSLTLTSCLDRHGLPIGKEHEALSDAFSTAQLFLCQLNKYQGEHIEI